MKELMGFGWKISAGLLCIVGSVFAGSTGILESADAVFAFNGNAKSQSEKMQGVERFVGDAGYLPYSFENEKNQVVSFNGQSAIEIPDLANLDSSQGLTIALRFRLDAQSGALVSQRAEAGRRSFQIACEKQDAGSLLRWTVSSAGGKDFSVEVPEIAQETWMTGVFVYDPGVSLSIFIDGKRVAHQEDPTMIPSSVSQISDLPWFVGAQPFPSADALSNHLRGPVDALAVWSRALTPEEIRQVSATISNGL